METMPYFTMKRLRFFLILALLYLAVVPAEAQKFTRKKRYINAGLNLNAMNYFGDLVPKSKWASVDLADTRWHIGGFVQKRLYPNIAGRLSLNFGRLQGDDFIPENKLPDLGMIEQDEWKDFRDFDIYRYRRNLHFRNDIIELSGDFIIDLVKNKGVFFRRPNKFIPYFFGGFAVIYSNPKAIAPENDIHGGGRIAQAGEWVALRKLQTEGQQPYSPVVVAVPFGIGVRKRVTDYIDVGFEIGYRYAFTDYLDDVSGVYKDLGFFNSDEFKGGDDNRALARAFSDRSQERQGLFSGKGDLRNNDIMFYNTRLITYPSTIDGRNYRVIMGYGGDPIPIDGNRRGNDDRDAYVVAGFHVSYIFDRNVKTPRFR